MSAVLSVQGVTKRYADVAAVSDVCLEVGAAEILALVGPSGCGKSTLLRLVAGLVAPDAGEILIDGELVAGRGAWCPPERRGVGIVFQDHALFPHLTVAQNVAFGLTGRDRASKRDRVEEVLALVGLEDHARRYPHELSGGEQQRVALVRALAPSPALILLDEPFSDLDRNLRERVRRETIDVLRRAGATAVFVTHDRDEALVTGDRVAVMRGGRLEQVASPAVVFHGPRNRFIATFLGEADFLPARRQNGALVTEAGSAPTPAGFAEGGEADVMVRPHEVVFEADGIAAEVVAKEYLGPAILYEVRLPSGRRLRSLQPHTVSHEVGSTVSVRLRHDHPPASFRGEDAVAGPPDA